MNTIQTELKQKRFTKENLENMERQLEQNQKETDEFIKKNNLDLIKLKNDYFNMSTYYWENKTKELYSVVFGKINSISSRTEEYNHIVALNKQMNII